MKKNTRKAGKIKKTISFSSSGFIILIISSLFVITNSFGQTSIRIAEDDASNYSPPTWATGTNEGTGFQSWAINTTGGGGSFYGGTNVGNPTFGIFSTNSGTSVADRPFDAALKPGDKFIVDIATTGIANNGEAGINLLSGTTVIFTIKFVGGTGSWVINDGGSDFGISQGFSNGRLTLQFTYEGSNRYSYRFGAANGFNFTFQTSVSSIDGVRFFSNNQGNGENLGFDNLRILEPAEYIALDFDGSDVVDATGSSSTLLPQGFDARSVEFSVRTNSFVGVQNIISWGTRSSTQRSSFVVRNGAAAFIGEFRDVTGTIRIDDGLWHHVAITHDGTNDINNIKIYVDGIEDTGAFLQGSNNGTNLNTSGQNLFLGRNASPNNNERYVGDLDNVRIWNVELTVDQVRDQAGQVITTPFPSGLIAYFKFEDAPGNADNSATGNDIITVVDETNNYDGSVTTTGVEFNRTGNTSNWIYTNGNFWNGNTNTVWSNGSNWSRTVPPSSSQNVIVGNVTNQPIIGSSTTVDINSLALQSGATLGVEGVLRLADNLSNDGAITFEGSASGSGQLDQFTGTITGSGDVTIERYIPANRAYRLLSSPVTTSGTIFENWQENGIYPISANGIGTHITGFQGTVGQFDASSGLDQTASGNPSMFTFDNVFVPTGAQTQFDGWNEVTSTNQTGDNLNAETPYLLFVRGDRSIDLASNSSTPNNTTLSATGNIFTGLSTQTLSGQPQYFSLVANPFQAIVDFNALTFTGLGNPNFMYVYDPAQKDYVTLDANVPADVQDMFIRPGQSVFVVNSPGTATASTVQFEQADINTSPSPGPGTTVFSDDFMAKLELELYNGSGELRENLRISFEDNASNAIDQFDAPKLTGGSEILASVNSGNIYTIERRAQVQSTDQVSILLDQYQGTDYEFRVTLENWNPDVEIFVADNYLGSTTQITPGQAYVFTVDSSIPESISENRFSLVFDNTTLGVDDNTFGSDFALYPNPTTDGQFSINTPNLSGDVNVEITSLLGQNVYSKDLSISGTQVDVNATGLSSGVYVVKLTQGNQSFSTKLIVE